MAVEYVAPTPGQPFGDIYSAAMPETQQAEQQIGQQQIYQQRLAVQQQSREQALFDRIQQQEVGKVLGADEPAVANAYKAWENADIAANTYRGHDPVQLAKLNRTSLQAYSEAARIAGESAQRKQQLDQYRKDMSIPGRRPLYSDDAADLLNAAYNTPTSQAKNYTYKGQQYDLTNPNTFAYQGANFQLMPKILQQAEGKPNKYTVSEPADAKGIQNRLTTYQFGALPAQYKTSVQQGLASSPQGKRYARYELAQLPEGEMDALDTQVKNIPLSKWKQMGLDGPQSLDPINQNDPAEVFASYLAKKRLVNTNPSVAGVKMETNLANEIYQKARVQLGNQETMERIRHGNREAEKAFGIDYAKQSAQDQTATNEYYVDKDLQDAQNPAAGGRSVIGPDGNVEYVSPGNAIMENALATGKGKTYVKPDEIRYNNDGTMVRGVFYQKDKNGHPIPDGQGGFKEAPNTGQSVTVESIKPIVGNQIKSLHQPASVGQSPKTENFPTDQNPANWKQIGNNYQYKDGSIWDANGKRVK